MNGTELGKILIESDLEHLHAHTRDYIRMKVATAIGVLLTIYLLTVILGRSITDPIQTLAQTARNVAEPFSQADASTTREFGGTGLGLSTWEGHPISISRPVSALFCPAKFLQMCWEERR